MSIIACRYARWAALVLLTSIARHCEAQTVGGGTPIVDQAVELCSAHPPGCTCLGCQAFYKRCYERSGPVSPCPPCPPQPWVPRGSATTPEEMPPSRSDRSEPLTGRSSEQSDTERQLSNGLGDMDQVPDLSLNAPQSSLSNGMGALAQSSSAAPNMIGDFFGVGGIEVTLQPPTVQVDYQNFTLPTHLVDQGSPTGGPPANSNPYYGQNTVVETTGTPVGTSQIDFIDPDTGRAFFNISSVTVSSGVQVPVLVSASGDFASLWTPDPTALTLEGSPSDISAYVAALEQLGEDSATVQANLQQQRDAYLAAHSGTLTTNPMGSTIANGMPTSITAVMENEDVMGDDELNDTYLVTQNVVYAFQPEYFTPDIIVVVLPNPSAGDIVGRVRLQDNNSARPQDRIYLDYSYFHNVPFSSSGTNVNRFSPGLEKTFFSGNASVEVRVPMAATISSDVVADGVTNFSNYEFGNLVIAPKFLLMGNRNSAVAAGMGIALPTANDINVSMVDDTHLLRVTNNSVHLLPYVAILYAPAYSNAFAHAFVTMDIDTRGNPVHANVNGTGLESIGDYHDQNLLSFDLAYGRWIYRDPGRHTFLDGLAWSTELHYTATLDDADVVTAGNYVVGNPNSSLSLLNGTIGGHARAGLTTFTAAYTAPLSGDDRVFDGEFRFFVNRNF